MQANKTADNQYLIPLMDGIIENIDIADGILLTTSDFVSQEDIEMTTTHDDLSLFQISFCIDGNMEWSYINNEVKRGYFMYSSLYGACWLFTGND